MPSDIKEGYRLAAQDFAGVQEDLRATAKEMSLKGLDGEARKDFFEKLTDEEFEQLRNIARKLGQRGMHELELILADGEELLR